MIKSLLTKCEKNPKDLNKEELSYIISNIDDDELILLTSLADKERQKHFQKRVYRRAIVEFTSYCNQNCFYCGIRKGNKNAERYRLTQEQILDSCTTAYKLGYRTFVLQSGEDKAYDTNKMCNVVYTIKKKFPDSAITLSVGEKTYEEYEEYFKAGANRFLLRHEAASKKLYEHIHPSTMSYDNRVKCLYNLKKIGFQTGGGFMVGLPTQTSECLAEDILFLKKLQPHMIGIGPFLAQHDTPFKNEPSGTLRQTIIMLALTRLSLPKSLLPATTALAALHPDGANEGLKAGANVIMSNMSPPDVRNKYLLYDKKADFEKDIFKNHFSTEELISKYGFCSDMGIGHHPDSNSFTLLENKEFI